MSFSSIGDLSQSVFLRRNNVALKTQLNTLSQELTTGLKKDVAKAVSHDFSLLSGLERGISLSETYLRSVNEARVFTQAAQNSLGLVQEEVETLSSSLLAVANSGLDSNINTMSVAAKQTLNTIVGALNTSVAGRFVFSGQATDTPPVLDHSALLDAIRPAALLAATPQDVITLVDNWFANGADYSTTAYSGTASASSGFLVGEGDTIAMNITADRPEIRDTLAAVVKVALLGDLTFPNGTDDAKIIMQNATEELLQASTQVTQVRGELGQAEEAIEIAGTRASAMRSALQINRSDLLAADPYETATALEDASTRLESLYTITARLSRLNLTDYLR